MKNFIKDLVVVDFEVTGFNFATDEPVQLGAVVLDKNTLEEKGSYVSWVKPEQEVNLDLPGFKWANLNEEDLQNINSARSLQEVAPEVVNVLPKDYTFCAWNAVFDFHFWNKLLQTVGKKTGPAGILDLWTLAYAHLLKDENYSGEYKSEPVFQYFGADPRKKHDALEDCRIEAMVLRSIINLRP